MAARLTARPAALKREVGSELSEASRCRRAAEKEDSGGDAGRCSQRRQAGTLMPAPRRRWGDPAIRRSGDPAIRRSGDPANYSENLNRPCQSRNAGRRGCRPRHRPGSTHKSHHRLSNPGVRPRRMPRYKRPREAHVSLLRSIANLPSQEKALCAVSAVAAGSGLGHIGVSTRCRPGGSPVPTLRRARPPTGWRVFVRAPQLPRGPHKLDASHGS